MPSTHSYSMCLIGFSDIKSSSSEREAFLLKQGKSVKQFSDISSVTKLNRTFIVEPSFVKVQMTFFFSVRYVSDM